MKNITPLFILMFVSTIYFAQKNPLVSDFRISEDNHQATFIQNNPNLFTNDEYEFIVAWEDYRNGDLSYFAQRFNLISSKIGSNFQVKSNFDICLGNQLNFLNLSSKHYNNTISGGGSVQFYATIYDQNNNIVNEEFSLGGVNIPWCGTGYLGYNAQVCKTENGYFFGLRDNGFLSLQKIDEVGKLIYTYSYSDSLNSSAILTFNLASNNKTDLTTTVELGNYLYEPTDSIYINGTIINENILTKKPIFFNIRTLISQNENLYWGDQNLTLVKNVSLSDSSFLIFDLFSDSLKLYYRKYNFMGERITQDSTIQLIENYIPSEYSYMSIRKFEVSQLKDDKFIVYISIDSSNRTFYNRIIVFDSFGKLLNSYTEKKDYRTNFGGQPFITSEKDFFTTRNSKQDIYLVKNNLFEEIDSTKINDDEQGSNDSEPLVVPINNSKYFITWNTEEGNYGRVINENGIAEGEQILLEGKTTIFLDEGRYVNFWKKRLSGDNAILGFTLYDDNWNVTKKDTFQMGGYYRLSYVVKKISDSLFVINSGETKSAKLQLYNLKGELIKKYTLEENEYSYNKKIFINDTNSLWVKWKSNLQLFNNNLEPISEIFQNQANEYLGNNKFLYTREESSYPYYQIVGTVLSSEGDTLTDKFVFSDILLNDYGSNKIKILPIDSSKFLVLFSLTDNAKSGKQVTYWRVYNDEGIPEYEKNIIHQTTSIKTNNASAIINSNKMFFVWSDLREGNKGYDIYGNIYDLNVITGIEEYNTNDRLPNSFSLLQNYPNPFNPTTTIKYTIPNLAHPLISSREGKEQSNRGVLNVTLKVYDILGKEVTVLVNQQQKSDSYEVTFDASNLSSGVYYYQLKSGDFVETKKMLILK